MKSIIIFLILLIPVMLAGQVGISFSFANNQITPGGVNGYYEFDVLASGQTPQNLVALQVYFTYSTTAFGQNINPASVTVTSPLPAGYRRTPNNTFPNTLSMALNYLGGPYFILPSSDVVVFHVKIAIADTNASTNIAFSNLMEGNQYFSDENYNTVQYSSPITYSPGLDETLPIELSSFTAMLSNLNLVTLQWITQSETNVSGYRIYRNTEADAASASMLNIFIPGTNTSQMQVYVFTDEEINQDGTYYYWLENLDMDGSSTLHGPISISVSFANTGSPSIPIQPGIHKVYPNPFHPVANLSLSVEKSAWVELDIYNLKGQKVRSVYSGNMDKGSKTLTWDGKDSFGKICANGMYLATMRCDGRVISKTKLILAK